MTSENVTFGLDTTRRGPHAVVAGQALRYGMVGALLSGLYSVNLWGLATYARLPVQTANAIAFLVNLAAGWWLHSRWSFRGFGAPGRERRAQAAFVAGNLAAYALNCFWVWLIVQRLGKPVAWSLLPIVTVTPACNFMLNRILVFPARVTR